MVSEFLRRYRVNLHFVSRGRVDYDSPSGEFIMLMEAVGNQYWGTKAKEVMKNGRRALVQDGIKPGQGLTLYGYIKSGDRRETRYEIAESAAVIIRRIFKEIAAGKAILAIARDLTTEGVPTPSRVAQMQRDKCKDYGIWTPKILHRILKNEAYAGTLGLNRTIGTHGKDLYYNPREKWVPVPMPPIIDRTLFDQAQGALAGHVSVLRDGGAYRQTFLMAGIIRCAHCANRGRPGQNIVTPSMRKSKGRPYGYYICSKSLLTYLAKEERENAETEAKIVDLEHTLSEQRAQQENLWLAMASLPKTATSAKTALHNVLNRLDEAIAEGVEKVMALRATLSPVPNSEALTTLWKHRDHIREGLQGVDTVEKRREMIDALNMTVSVYGVEGKPKATLHWWGPDTPLTLEDETPDGQGPNLGPETTPPYGTTGNAAGRYPHSADKKAYQVSCGLART